MGNGTRVGRRIAGAATGLLSLVLVTACQPAPVAVRPTRYIPTDGVGYIVFNTTISGQSRDLLISDIGKLIDAGARTIRLGINSAGGEVIAAQGIVDYVNQVHATRGVQFESYDLGLVASAATYVYLSAQRRIARPNSGFLFHAAGLVSTGPVSAERLREEADKIESYERAVRSLLKARTRLSDAAIDIYLHRTVILTADDARRDGVVNEISNVLGPPGAEVVVIAPVRRPGTPPPVSPPPTLP